MKVLIFVFISLVLISCKETTEIYDEARGEVRTCNKEIGSYCANDGSRCINECGEKLFTIICYKSYSRIIAIGLTGARLPAYESDCDVMFDSEYDYAVWKIEQLEKEKDRWIL